MGLILGGEFVVSHAPIFDDLAFDPFALSNNGLFPAEVGIGQQRWRKVYMQLCAWQDRLETGDRHQAAEISTLPQRPFIAHLPVNA